MRSKSYTPVDAIAIVGDSGSPQEARDWLESHGVSVAEFARRHGLNRHHVSDALRGKTKGRRGLAHDAAVALGIKKGADARRRDSPNAPSTAHLTGKPLQPREMNDTKSQESGQAQRRIVETIFCLAGHELMGLSTVEVQRALDRKHASLVTRDLQVLLDMGVAEQVPETGRWRLGPRMVRIARDFEIALQKAASRVKEIEQRYTRSGA